MYYIANSILKDEHYSHDAVQNSFLKIIKNIVNKYHGDLFIDYHDDQVIFNIKINT